MSSPVTSLEPRGTPAPPPTGSPRPAPAIPQRLVSNEGWVWIGVLTLLFCTLFYNFLQMTYQIAGGPDPIKLLHLDLAHAFGDSFGSDWSHALAIPFIALFFIHESKDELVALTRGDRRAPRDLLACGRILAVMVAMAAGFVVLRVAGPALNVGMIPHSRREALIALTVMGPLIAAAWVSVAMVIRRVPYDRAFALLRFAGIVVLLVGIGGYVFGIYPGRNMMVQGYSIILALFGLVLMLAGPAAMRVLWFPIFYLAMAVKVSDRLWEALAVQLQGIAATVATIVIRVVGTVTSVDADLSGSTITVYHHGKMIEPPLNVAEACSGLHMLMAFVALGAAMAFLFNKTWWQRVIVVGMCVPIAILVNAGRVALMGFLSIWKPDWVQGPAHKSVGMLMLIPAFGLFWVLGWVMERIIIEGDDEAKKSASASAATVNAAPSSDKRARAGGSRIAQAAIAGAVMTAMLGASYLLYLVVKAPAMFPGWPGGTTSRAMLGGAVLVLAVALVFVARLLRPEMRPTGRLPVATLAIAASVLLVSTVSTYGVIATTRIALQKLPIALRHPIDTLPSRLGEWTVVKDFGRLPEDEENGLGTKDYITREYARPTADGQAAIVTLHIAYYTGTIETVPHVPERCFVASGLEPLGISQHTLSVGGPSYSEKDGKTYAIASLDPVLIPRAKFPATVFTYAIKGVQAHQANVAYFFAANGQFLATPDEVRAYGFNLTDRHSYFCKIEIRMDDIAEPDRAAERASDFLSAALPQIMACLPDWDQVKADEAAGK